MFKISLLTFFALPLLLMIPAQSGSCLNKASDNFSDPQKEKVERVALGVWGGQHIRMQVTENGAEIEYDCANGAIHEPLVLDAQGRFEVKGTHASEPRGPVRMGEVSDGRPARFTGSIDGKRMTLNVTLTDKQKKLDTYTLTEGDSGRLWKCQ
ncbi:MAG: hypothetical protein WCF57_21845 [Pyrinomonadaceae bacterium]